MSHWGLTYKGVEIVTPEEWNKLIDALDELYERTAVPTFPPQEESAYTIFIEDSTTKAKSGKTGEIEFSGLDASAVMQSAVDATTTNGGTIVIKSGDYGSVSITLKDKVHLIIDKNAVTITISIDSGATCTIEDRNVGKIRYYKAGSLTSELDLAEKTLTELASYIIFIDGTTIKARNGQTGAIEFSGTDASTVIQQAINALGTSGGRVFIKAGTYTMKVSSLNTYGEPICISKNDVTLEGEQGTLLKADASLKYGVGGYDSGYIIVIRSLVLGTPVERVVIRNIHIDGNQASGAETGGINIDAGTINKNIIIDNVYVENCSFFGGMVVSGKDVLVENCVVKNCVVGHTSGTRAGIFITALGTTDFTVKNCFVCDNSDIYGILLEDRPEKVLVEGCIISNNGSHGIYAETSAYGDNVFRGNLVLGNGAYGILISGTGRNVVEGNICANSKRAGISISTDNCNVVGNICFNNGQDATEAAPNRSGIKIVGAYNVVIGNRCFDNQETKTQQYGIATRETLSNYNIITNNDCIGNADATEDISYVDTGSLIINNLGRYVPMSGLSKVRAYQSTSQTLPSGTLTKVNLQSENFDLLGEFDTSTSRFTAAYAGYRRVTGAVCILAMVDQKEFDIYIYKNGSYVTNAFIQASGTGGLAIQVCDTIYLDIGDYLELYAFQNSGADQSISASSLRTFLAIEGI
jgi:parallel beta-helix repeat protein